MSDPNIQVLILYFIGAVVTNAMMLVSLGLSPFRNFFDILSGKADPLIATHDHPCISYEKIDIYLWILKPWWFIASFHVGPWVLASWCEDQIAAVYARVYNSFPPWP